MGLKSLAKNRVFDSTTIRLLAAWRVERDKGAKSNVAWAFTRHLTRHRDTDLRARRWTGLGIYQPVSRGNPGVFWTGIDSAEH